MVEAKIEYGTEIRVADDGISYTLKDLKAKYSETEAEIYEKAKPSQQEPVEEQKREYIDPDTNESTFLNEQEFVDKLAEKAWNEEQRKKNNKLKIPA